MENQSETSTNANTPNPVPTKKKISNILYSIFFELPFENYDEYYKSGKIQKMTREEKIQLIIENNRKKQHLEFFRKLLLIRPSFLDEEDYYSYNEELHKVKKLRMGVTFGLGINWSYFVYNFFIKKRMVIKSFLLMNGILFSLYIAANIRMSMEIGRLFEKYKKDIKREELEKVIKESYRIE